MLKLPLSGLPTAPEVVLDSKRAYLRPPQERDYAAWCEVRQESRAFLSPWEPVWPADALSRDSYRRRLRRYAQNWRSDAGFAFFAFERGTDVLLGGVTLSNIRRGVVQSASLGYWIGVRHAQQGFMTECVREALVYAYDRVHLHRVEAACLPTNEPSRRLLVRLGFEQEGYAKEYLCIAGLWQDHLLFGQVSTAFRAKLAESRHVPISRIV